MKGIEEHNPMSDLANTTIAENKQVIKTLKALSAEISKTLKNYEHLLEELGLTKEDLQHPEVSESGLPPEQKKLFDMLLREFVAEINAKGPPEGKKALSKITKRGIRI